MPSLPQSVYSARQSASAWSLVAWTNWNGLTATVTRGERDV